MHGFMVCALMTIINVFGVSLVMSSTDRRSPFPKWATEAIGYLGFLLMILTIIGAYTSGNGSW